MSPLNCLLVEDEFPARRFMLDAAKKRADIEIAAVARSLHEAKAFLKQENFDLIFLDIELPDGSGLDLLIDLPHETNVVLTTAYDYALRAFDIGVADYLYKPFSEERLQVCIERILLKRTATDSVHKDRLGMVIKEAENKYLVSYYEILYLSSHGKQTVLHTEKQDYTASKIMGDIESDLPSNMFQRIHKQFIVNLRHISHIQHVMGGRYRLFLKDDDETWLPVGRAYAADLVKTLGV